MIALKNKIIRKCWKVNICAQVYIVQVLVKTRQHLEARREAIRYRYAKTMAVARIVARAVKYLARFGDCRERLVTKSDGSRRRLVRTIGTRAKAEVLAALRSAGRLELTQAAPVDNDAPGRATKVEPTSVSLCLNHRERLRHSLTVTALAMAASERVKCTSRKILLHYLQERAEVSLRTRAVRAFFRQVCGIQNRLRYTLTHRRAEIRDLTTMFENEHRELRKYLMQMKPKQKGEFEKELEKGL